MAEIREQELRRRRERAPHSFVAPSDGPLGGGGGAAGAAASSTGPASGSYAPREGDAAAAE
eukprot:14065804-Alexandrium_andersonii.AAC.1